VKAISDTACSFFVDLVITQPYHEVLSRLNEDHAKRLCGLKTSPNPVLAKEYLIYNKWLESCVETLRGSTGASILYSTYNQAKCDVITGMLNRFSYCYTNFL